MQDGGGVHVGLIGAGIGESLSPALHEREAALLGLDYDYRLFDLDELGRRARGRRRAGARGARASGCAASTSPIPCKQLVVPELDELSPEAAALGAVNTSSSTAAGWSATTPTRAASARRSSARLPGARTDRVVLLGAGGAGAAVAHAASRSARGT